ncbi:AP-4 complex accessory subunit tepsin [Neosynchiropus ocellatus]
MATFMERLAFLQKLPTLMKATADDENPCPGYLFQEIGSILYQTLYLTLNWSVTSEISQESLGSDQCLLEYLLERLQVESCHVKLKVLKIFVHLCGHGSNNFLTELRRNSTFIQQASVYCGPPDPIHGTALYQKVRNTAQEVARLLFTDPITIKSGNLPPNITSPSAGMGSGVIRRTGMQGFGYNPGKQGSATDSLLDKIQKAAEVVASAVLPPTEHQGIRLHDNHYRAIVAPSTPIEVAVPACAYNLTARKPKGGTQRSPGQVGGGWEEAESCNSSSQNSSQEITANSQVSVGSHSAGTGSQSGASRESGGDLSERVEALQLGDCVQEMALINGLTEGSRVFLSREESQRFVKECSTLNCEVVLELLSRKLQEPSNVIKMRALSAVSCLMTSDLLSLEQMFGVTQRQLCALSEGPPGPVANKATKILRQFEALMPGPLHLTRQPAASCSVQETPGLIPTNSDALLFNNPAHNLMRDLTPDASPLHVNHLSCSSDQATSDHGGDEPQQAEACNADSPPGERQCAGTLSLFRGMELVSKERSQYGCTQRDSVREEPAADSPVTNVSNQPSAFSFLNV